MKISRSSFVYRVANTFGNPDKNLCSLARCFVFSCVVFAFTISVTIALIGGLFFVSGQLLGETIASLTTWYFDEDAIFRFVFGSCLYTIYALAAVIYYSETRDIHLIENVIKFFEKKNKKEQNVYWEMLKSFTGKFCVRVEYTYDKE